MTLIGYCRVSKGNGAQDLRRQIDQLKAIGCDVIIEESMSGKKDDRPGLARALAKIGPGDTLAAVSLDRIGRSLIHLLEIIKELQQRQGYFRILNNPIDTSSAYGVLITQIIGAVAEFELAMIGERTKDGVEAARRRGRVGGNPRLKAGDPDAIQQLREIKNDAFLKKLIATADTWMQTVRLMRPQSTWQAIASALNNKQRTSLPKQKGARPWTAQRLRRAVRTLVNQHMADPALLQRAAASPPGDMAMALVASITKANPELTLKEIGQQLTAVHCNPPRGRGGKKWALSSIKALRDRARRLGLVSTLATSSASSLSS